MGAKTYGRALQAYHEGRETACIHESRELRDSQIRFKRLSCFKNKLHKHAYRTCGKNRSGYPGHIAGHGARRPHRTEIPARGNRLRRKLFPQRRKSATRNRKGTGCSDGNNRGNRQDQCETKKKIFQTKTYSVSEECEFRSTRIKLQAEN